MQYCIIVNCTFYNANIGYIYSTIPCNDKLIQNYSVSQIGILDNTALLHTVQSWTELSRHSSNQNNSFKIGPVDFFVFSSFRCLKSLRIYKAYALHDMFFVQFQVLILFFFFFFFLTRNNYSSPKKEANIKSGWTLGIFRTQSRGGRAHLLGRMAVAVVAWWPRRLKTSGKYDGPRRPFMSSHVSTLLELYRREDGEESEGRKVAGLKIGRRRLGGRKQGGKTHGRMAVGWRFQGGAGAAVVALISYPQPPFHLTTLTSL